MIVAGKGETEAYEAQGLWGRATLDGLLARLARETPDRPAIADAPDKAALCEGAPLSLTFAEADELVDRLAGRFLALGLKSDDVVAVQLGNVAENYLTLLALMRANLVASPLPPLWRDHEIKAALKQAPPRAIVTATRIGGHRHAEMMRYIAAELSTVRQVLAFGAELPDGVMGLSDVFGDGETGLSAAPREDAANHAATLTWQVCAEAAPRPVPRSHNHWLAAAQMHVMQAGIGPDDTMLAPYFPSGMLALASSLGAWLLSGARLALYQPGGQGGLARRLVDEGVTYAVLPPAWIEALAGDGVLDQGVTSLRAVGCAWPSPELAYELAVPDGMEIFDLYAFDETATYCARRDPDRSAGTMPLGPVSVPEGDARGAVVLEARLGGGPRKAGSAGTALAGSLFLRGPMVPSHMSYALEDAQAVPGLAAGGYVATGLACEICAENPPALRFTGREDGVVTIGSALVSLADLDRLLAEHSGMREAAAFAVPDPLLGNTLHAAGVALPSAHVSLADIHHYLTARKVAPYKFPDTALSLEAMPRRQDGSVDRLVLAGRAG